MEWVTEVAVNAHIAIAMIKETKRSAMRYREVEGPRMAIEEARITQEYWCFMSQPTYLALLLASLISQPHATLTCTYFLAPFRKIALIMSEDETADTTRIHDVNKSQEELAQGLTIGEC
jgi:hypothetical protein